MRLVTVIALSLILMVTVAAVSIVLYRNSSAKNLQGFQSEELSDAEMQELLKDAEALNRRIAEAKPKHAKGVTAGQGLAWRELDSQPETTDDMRWFIRVAVGNFDPDADQEILHTSGQDMIIEADGARLQLDYPDYITTPGGPSRPGSFVVWDYDGDGVDDLIDTAFDRLHADAKAANRQQLKDHMVAYNLRGKLLGEIAGVPMGPYIARGDLNGDGKEDLFMDEEGDYGPNPEEGTRGFTTLGKVILEAGNEWSMVTCLGDIDDDGLDEVVGTPSAGDIMAIGVGQKAVPVPQLNAPDSGFFYQIDTCLDFDGDGVDECMTYHGHVLNLVSGQKLQLEPPPGYEEFIAGSSETSFFQELDYGGQQCVVAMVGEDIVLPETVIVWDRQGKVVYAENLGEFIQDLHVLRAGGLDYLVVLTRNELLIAP